MRSTEQAPAMSAPRPGAEAVVRQAAPVAISVAVLVWFAVVAGNGVLLALRAAGLPLFTDEPRDLAKLQSGWAVGLVIVVCLAAALLARRYRPALTLPVTLAAGGAIVLAGAASSGALGPLLVACALIALCWLAGEAVLARLPITTDASVVRLPIAIGLGSGLWGLVLLLLATFGALNAVTVGICAADFVVLSLWGTGRGSRIWLPRTRATQESPLQMRFGTSAISHSWLETVVIGLTAGLVAYALLAAFLPEVHSDAVRHHLPIAREMWQTGSAPEFSPMWTSRFPVEGHLLYAVAYGFGGMTAAKLVHAGVGLAAIAGVAGIGWLVGGRLAATLGAAIFATLPLVLWELGLSLVDLFPVLYAVAAVLCLLLWQREGHAAWLVSAGALAGFGFAAKMTMGLTAMALAAAILLVGRGPWRPRERRSALIMFGLGALVVIPWLARSYVIIGAVPGASILAEHATGTASTDLLTFGLGRSPLALLRIPWEMTFQGELFHQQGAGDLGIALLMLLPLALCAPRTRTVALVAVTMAVSFLGWALTAQLTRYLLPTLALTAALAGIGAACVVASPTSWARPLRLAVPAALVLGLAAAPLFLLSGVKPGLPIDLAVLAGRETTAAYVAEHLPGASVATAATDLLPADMPVVYIGRWEGAQIYSEVRLTYFVPPRPGSTHADVQSSLDAVGATDEEILATFARMGVNHFIWERSNSRPEIWRAPLLATSFLRAHTRILAAADGAYLFALTPQGGHGWGEPDQNLLQDPELNNVATGGPWTTEGKVKSRKKDLEIQPTGSLTQQVAAAAGNPYLLTATGACDQVNDRALLALHWLDAQGAPLSAAAETVVPGVDANEQFLWQRAPVGTAAVTVELATSGGATCDFTEVALVDLA